MELTKACLNRIEQLNPKLNAFITISAESSLKEAATADIEIRNGKWKGPLHGIPIALKDNIDTENNDVSKSVEIIFFIIFILFVKLQS